MPQIPTLNLNKTAYVAIDLQDDILNAPGIDAAHRHAVLTANNQLADYFKNTGALIVQVTVNVASVQNLFPRREVTQPVTPNQAKLVMPIASDSEATNVIKITKHNPGAFFGTDLDLQLRRRGIDTIILGGISTSNGVYATALDAYQNAYRLIVVEDACMDRDAEKHAFFFDKMFNRISYVTTTSDLLASF